MCVLLCERQCDSPCVRVQGWVCTRVAPVCVCAALSPHCREEEVGAAAKALLSQGAGHLAGAVGGKGHGSILGGQRRPGSRWAATPWGHEGAWLTAGARTPGRAGAEGVSCPKPSVYGVWVWGGGGGSSSDSGPQAGVPVDSGIHFLSWSWDRHSGPDWPGQVNHTPLSPRH